MNNNPNSTLNNLNLNNNNNNQGKMWSSFGSYKDNSSEKIFFFIFKFQPVYFICLVIFFFNIKVL